MASQVEEYNPNKATGYTIDQFVQYERQLYKCKQNTPKPAGAFNDDYWNLIGYLLDSDGILNYQSETVSMEYIDPETIATVQDLQEQVATLQTSIGTVSSAVSTETQNRKTADTNLQNTILGKFKYVTALPANPDSSTFYFIKE